MPSNKLILISFRDPQNCTLCNSGSISNLSAPLSHFPSMTSPAPYNSLPATAPPSTFLTRSASTTTNFFATRRPWRELIEFSSFTRPLSFGEATIRVKRNLYYFRVNYTMIILSILFLSLLWHPLSMIVFLIVFVGWFFLYFFRDQPLVIIGRSIDDRVVLGLLAAITIVALIFTHVWLNVLVSVLIGVAVVVLHAAFRGTENLYVEEHDLADEGLFSFVGSPVRGGNARV